MPLHTLHNLASFSQPEPASDSCHLCRTAGSMPDMLQSDEKMSPMKNQIVMTPGFLCDKSWLGGSSHVFAQICQYLSSTVRDLAPSIRSPQMRKVLGPF